MSIQPETGSPKPSHAHGSRQCARFALAFMALAATAGCANKPQIGTIGYVQGFAGMVAADEPRAVLVARDILASGGSAGDAAVALAFTMAVTNPSSAGLGGGGVCLAYDPKRNAVEALEFFPIDSRKPVGKNGRPTAVPAMPRGLYALHAKYGTFRWEQLLIPAENIARFGGTVSRSLANDLAVAGDTLMGDSDARRIFLRPDGYPLKEGEPLPQVDLAATIGRLRVRGPGDFYTGAGARELADSVSAAGGTLTVEDLRDVTPRWVPTLSVPFGVMAAHFPPPPSGGALAGQLWAAMIADNRWEKTPAEERPHLLAEASARALTDRVAWMRPDGSTTFPPEQLVSPTHVANLMGGYDGAQHIKPASPGPGITENQAAAGFAIADRDGMAVACTLTMNSLFGVGHTVPGTGMLLAASPNPAGRGPYALTPMLVVKRNVSELVFAGGASGGAAAPAAIVDVAAQTLLGGKPLVSALAAPRLVAGPATDVLFIENAENPALAEGLKSRGHVLARVHALGRVNAVACPDGLPAKPATCTAGADPRAAGHALVVGPKS